MMNVIKTKASLDAKPSLVCRAVDTFNKFDLIVFDLQRYLTANTTERTDAFNLFVIISAVANLIFINYARGHQRPGWTGLNTFAARHTA